MYEGGVPLLTTPCWCAQSIEGQMTGSGPGDVALQLFEVVCMPFKLIARFDGIGQRVSSITTVLSVFTVSLQSESHLDVALTET